jgi:hypothetical protein
MARRKTWLEKLNSGSEPHVEKTSKLFCGIPAGSLLLISNSREVQALVKRIPEGRALTQAEVRARLAKRHHADAACPISTGIFLRIVAEAAWEEIAAGKDPSEVTPFWRIVEPGSPLAKKLTCGTAFVERMRRSEGIASC